MAVFLALLGLMSLAHLSQHLGLMWIAIETATLCTVPLLHFNRTARAFEATWKYLLVGGTGIARDVVLAALAAGTDHTCGRSQVGSAICWGRNTAGQVGDVEVIEQELDVLVVFVEICHV